MCEIGMRVRVVPGPGRAGGTGLTVGHVGSVAVVAMDEGGMRGVPDEAVIPIRGTKRRTVVVQPDGRSSVLSRRDTERIRIRTGRP